MDLKEVAWKTAMLCVGWPYIFGDRGELCTIPHRKAVYNKGQEEEKYKNVRKACQAIREKDPTDRCSGCKWYPEGKRVRAFDCRGFTYWILLQVYGWKLMGGGATAQWNDDNNWTAKGTIDSIPEDTLVCLFCQDKTNKKVMSHTGMGYQGETVECSAGVQHFEKRKNKWTHWALPKCVDGEAPAPTPPDPDKKPTLRKGDSGAYVAMAQAELINRGYDLGAWGADGKFGNQTEKAVKEFQKDHGLKADGIIGADTWKALDETEPTAFYTVTIPHVTQKQAEGLCLEWNGATMREE